MKFRACSAAWASRFFRLRAVCSPGGRRRNKKSAASCWLTFGKLRFKRNLCRESETKRSRLPDKVKVNVDNDGAVAVEGPEREVELDIAARDIKARWQTTTSRSSRGRDAQRESVARTFPRAALTTWCSGVSEGFTKNLEIEGVGFKAAVQGRT